MLIFNPEGLMSVIITKYNNKLIGILCLFLCMSCGETSFQGNISEYGIISEGSKLRIGGDTFVKNPKNTLKELSKTWFYFIKLEKYPDTIFLIDFNYAGTIKLVSDLGNAISFQNIEGQKVILQGKPKDKLIKGVGFEHYTYYLINYLKINQ
ncbi:MAG: hypothetical protein M0P73_13055 [Syntrophobacterales bacterium]|jgi:hypothetical protein|nr:hypothetical protein [Syntrophobacterales bacterium]